jgi:AAA+ ATPase superfamily predicted ATPase
VVSTYTKPADVFDRAHEWDALTRFVTSGQDHATLGVVSGRRRQGKTYLLQALCEATGGFFFAAEQAVEAESLRLLGDALTNFLGVGYPVRFTDWRQAVDALLTLGDQREIPVVIDELPYLVSATPSLPSILQNAFAPRRAARQGSRTRLLLCGSALSFMGQLLSGTAPLRGRAGLEIVVPTLDYRLAADFWGIDEPRLAVKLHAVVGGTPAYRREFVEDDVPAGRADFDAWALRTVLNPASPLFREARYLLSEEPGIRDPALYHSVLAAVALGSATSGGIAAYVGRKASDITHHLAVLEDCGLLQREVDAFRSNRMLYRITEPLITFYQAIMRPEWSEWEHRHQPEQLWEHQQQRFATNVLGPHFEELCRTWARRFAPDGYFGDRAGRVAAGTVNDPQNRTSHQVDVAVFGRSEGDRPQLLAIGEAKWGKEMSTRDVARLRRIRNLLAATGRYDTSATQITCYSGKGFSPALQQEAAAGDLVLVGLDQLYGRVDR